MAFAPPSSPSSPSVASPHTVAEPSQPSSFLWKNLFTESTPPTSSPSSTLPDGTPVILAPPDILLNASAAWSGYILCQFFGDNPSPAKIFSDLNPIWGRQGKITVKSFSEGTCLIFVPSLSTRKWILDSCLWSAGTVSFAVSEWSPTPSLIRKSLTSAPAWLTIRGLPPQLWSEAGAKLIASRLGSVVPSSRVILPPDSLGTAKVRVILRLDAARPPTVIVQDSQHNQVRISVDYGRLPPLCPSCSCYGHLAHRCPSRRRPNPDTSVPPPTSNSSPPRVDSSSKVEDIVSAPVQPPPSSIYLPPADSDLVSPAPVSLLPTTVAPVPLPVPAKSSSGDEVLLQNPNSPPFPTGPQDQNRPTLFDRPTPPFGPKPITPPLQPLSSSLSPVRPSSISPVVATDLRRRSAAAPPHRRAHHPSKPPATTATPLLSPLLVCFSRILLTV